MFWKVDDKNVQTENMPFNSNLINTSLLKDFSGYAKFRSFSIKYVVSGIEDYIVNGNKYLVCDGQYILGNASCEGHVRIGGKKPVRGICIDIAPEVISEVMASFLRPDTAYPDIELDKYFHTDSFLENCYNSCQTHLGKELHSLNEELKRNSYKNYESSKYLYYQLAEKIIIDHISIYKKLQNIPVVKWATRKELFRRVSKGKKYIDENYSLKIDIDSAAKEAALSEYYFYRMFKFVYNIPPHKYLIEKRLQLAHRLLQEHSMNVTEVALLASFADLHSFSKSFKNRFGYSPSSLIKK